MPLIITHFERYSCCARSDTSDMPTLEELHTEQQATPLLLRGGNVVRMKNPIIQLGILPEFKEQHPAYSKKKLIRSSVTKYGKIKKP